MKSLGHAILGIIIAIIFFPYLGYGAIIIAVSSVLIDLDHINILFREKAFTIKKIIKVGNKYESKWAKEKHKAFDGEIFILHSLEINIAILLLSFIYKPLIFVSVGFIIHIFTDMIHHSYHEQPIKQWLFLLSNLKLTK